MWSTTWHLSHPSLLCEVAYHCSSKLHPTLWFDQINPVLTLSHLVQSPPYPLTVHQPCWSVRALWLSSTVDAFAPLPSFGKPAHLDHPLLQEPLHLMTASLSIHLGSDVPMPSALSNTLPSKELPAALIFGAFSGCSKISEWSAL